MVMEEAVVVAVETVGLVMREVVVTVIAMV